MADLLVDLVLLYSTRCFMLRQLLLNYTEHAIDGSDNFSDGGDSKILKTETKRRQMGITVPLKNR